MTDFWASDRFFYYAIAFGILGVLAIMLMAISSSITMERSRKHHRLIVDCIPIAAGHKDVSGDVQVFCEKVIADWKEEERLEKVKKEEEKMRNLRKRMQERMNSR